MQKISLNQLDAITAELLQTATNRMAERVNQHNPVHATTLRRMAMDLEKDPPTVGEINVIEAFLLQTAALQLARVAIDKSHAEMLNNIVRELDEKIHKE